MNFLLMFGNRNRNGNKFILIFTLLISLLWVIPVFMSKTVFSDEVVSTDELKRRINMFNEWYKFFNPEEGKVEAKLTDDPEFLRIGLFAKEDLKADDVIMNIDRSKMISAKMIYDTKFGQFFRDYEKTNGYDDYANFIFYLLHEMNNNESEWKAYLDILPRQPTLLLYNYKEKKNFVEDKLLNMPVLKKLIDFKFLVERRARTYYNNIVKNNTELFNPEVYNIENIEWACIFLDARLIFISYEAFLVPMLDLANFKENKDHPEKVLKLAFAKGDNKVTQFKSFENISHGQQIFINKGLNNDKYLISHGMVIKDNSYDCFSMSLSFSSRYDDPLSKQRKTFFAKFFLYDSNYTDEIYECISAKKPFSRRFLFYYYTLLMDENDLTKTDPKRVGLENDRIIVEYVKDALQGMLDINLTTKNVDQAAIDAETEPYKKHVLQYILEQNKQLQELIYVYHQQALKLNKEDIL